MLKAWRIEVTIDAGARSGRSATGVVACGLVDKDTGIADADGGSILSLIGEDLDSGINGPIVVGIVLGFFAVKDDCRSARSLGVGSHLQLVLRGWLELGLSDKRGCRDKQHCPETKKRVKTH
jgi:hypothetical protein